MGCLDDERRTSRNQMVGFLYLDIYFREVTSKSRNICWVFVDSARVWFRPSLTKIYAKVLEIKAFMPLILQSSEYPKNSKYPRTTTFCWHHELLCCLGHSSLVMSMYIMASKRHIDRLQHLKDNGSLTAKHQIMNHKYMGDFKGRSLDRDWEFPIFWESLDK